MAILSKWSGRSLTLDMRILVSKIFVFSVFSHVLNVVHITNAQIDLIQKMLNKFVWCSWNKIRLSVMSSQHQMGGMNMLQVCDVLHTLRTKWMFCLTKEIPGCNLCGMTFL